MKNIENDKGLRLDPLPILRMNLSVNEKYKISNNKDDVNNV